MLVVSGLQASGDPSRGKELAQLCADCHRDDLLGDEDVPAIGGKDEAYIIKALMAFKSGERIDEYEDMVETVKVFNEEDFADLAAYISTLPGPEE
jgi:cytochrome c553